MHFYNGFFPALNRTMIRSQIRCWIEIVILATALSTLAMSAEGQSVIHIPSEAKDLQEAFSLVPDGGIIEFAAGTYAAPRGGFTNYSSGKAMTVRAAQGAVVTLTGGGTTDLLRFTNSKRAQGKPMTFIGITFSNGVTTQNFIGGAMTLGECEAIFRNCTFNNNKTQGNVAAAGALFIAGSVVTFDGCVFKG